MMILRAVSALSGIEHEMEIPLSLEEFKECYGKWRDGFLIHHAFPTLDSNEREFIKSGITPQEWEALMNQGFDA